MYTRIYWVVVAILGLFSPALFALGLGGAVVESYLDQPLDVRVELISQSNEELQSITAGLASVDDFKLLGLSRAAISVPLEFELVTDTENPYIHITSQLNVNEPVVQVLVEVVWASGRMLREYTLFLDPPTFESVAPPVTVRSTPKPAQVKTPSQQSTPPPAAIVRSDPVPETPAPAAEQPALREAIVEEPVADEPIEEEPVTEEPVTEEPVAEEPVADEPAAEEPVAEEPVTEESVAEEPVADEPAAEEPAAEEVLTEEPDAEDADFDQASSEDSDAVESTPEQEQEQEQEPEQTDEQFSGDEVYGPVARGETLWGIARDFSKGSGYSINQAMLAMQRKNPDAFIKGNINSLKQGAILRLPAFNEIAELTSREAMLEVMRQEEEIRTGVRTVAPDFSTPTLADSGDYQESVTEPAPEPVLEEEIGHLEIVPPAEKENQDSSAEEQTAAQVASSDQLMEELSRTEEELVNAQQENTYLTQRIQELETQVVAQTEKPVGIEDTDLANMESSLAQDRASDKPEPPVALTPGGEDQPWYAGKTALIGGIAIALIALIVWGLRRRNAGLLEAGLAGSVAATAVEAEETSRTSDPVEVDEVTVVQMQPEPEPKPEPEPEPESEPEPEPADTLPMLDDDEAETVVQLVPELQPESAPETDIGFADEEDQGDEEPSDDDPEIKLDLARAYLSLGDKEASRSMLEEVLKGGNESQKAEARQMLDEF